MKLRLICATFLALTFASFSYSQNAAPSSSTRVAVIDISKVFKEHPRFKQAMEAMRQEVKAFEGKLQVRGQEIQKIQAQMKTFQPGSAEYKSHEEQILQIQAAGQVEAAKQKKAFLEKEAKIYYSVYNEVVNEVAEFAKQNGIAIVVRFNSEPIDPNNRQSVLEGVNRAVVYQSQSNITNAILNRLIRKNGGAAQQAATAANNGGVNR